jgi:hypothetical protein
VHHGRAEQAPLDTGLNLQGRVGGDQLLEPGNVATMVIGTIQRRREGPVHGVVVHQVLQLPEDPGAVFSVREAFGLVQFKVSRQGTRVPAGVRPLAQQLLAEGSNVDGGLPGRLSDGSGSR